ncbi:hypothetical protein Ddc_23523 [Ditylenchus destructor]|nr:hypothetical protein Ddc_23523 [Ditylenchus destructor]
MHVDRKNQGRQYNNQQSPECHNLETLGPPSETKSPMLGSVIFQVELRADCPLAHLNGDGPTDNSLLLVIFVVIMWRLSINKQRFHDTSWHDYTCSA